MNRSSGFRVEQLRLSGSSSSGKRYEVVFTDDSDVLRPLAVVAGQSQTGKTTVAEFIRYCLGGQAHPQHSEVARTVRSAAVQVRLAGERYTIERSATGPASAFASVWDERLDHLLGSKELRLAIEPPSDPDSLSQFLLEACGLQGVALPVAPTQEDSESHALSIRDLFKLVWLPNERLDSKNLVLESNYAVARKFRQTVDAVFGIDDADGVAAAAQLRLARQNLREAESVTRSMRALVSEQFPEGAATLEMQLADLNRQVDELQAELSSIDRSQAAQGGELRQLRVQLQARQLESQRAWGRVRDRESLLDRLGSLRSQYIDDQRKLAFLAEAERLFDPLHVSVCPSCLSELGEEPTIHDGHCSLCGSIFVDEADRLSVEAESASSPVNVLRAELRATNRRLKEATDYWVRLDEDLGRLKRVAEQADEAMGVAAAAIDSVVDLPTPFLALRDSLQERHSSALIDRERLATGLRLWGRVTEAEEKADKLRGQVQRLREERARVKNRPDRSRVIAQLSTRYGEILSAIGYPKLARPYINADLVPFVRDQPYTGASSGGQVLISLAWYLSFWEVSFETSEHAPGLLIVDSPQKNLGHKANNDDPDFGDARLVENFYRHAKRWLASEGEGAQLIVIDNSPPDIVADDVVVRYSRLPDVPPYGLIDDAVD